MVRGWYQQIQRVELDQTLKAYRDCENTISVDIVYTDVYLREASGTLCISWSAYLVTNVRRFVIYALFHETPIRRVVVRVSKGYVEGERAQMIIEGVLHQNSRFLRPTSSIQHDATVDIYSPRTMTRRYSIGSYNLDSIRV